MCVWHPAAGRSSRNTLSVVPCTVLRYTPTRSDQRYTALSHAPVLPISREYCRLSEHQKLNTDAHERKWSTSARAEIHRSCSQTATCGAHNLHILFRVIILLQPHELSMTQHVVTTSSKYVCRTKQELPIQMTPVSITVLARVKTPAEENE